MHCITTVLLSNDIPNRSGSSWIVCTIIICVLSNKRNFRKLGMVDKKQKKLGPTPEEIDAALAEHNQHEEWIEIDENFNLEALREILHKEMNDKRDEE